MQTSLSIKHFSSEVELGWQSQVGREYQIVLSDLKGSRTPFSGVYQGDGDYFLVRVPKTSQEQFYELWIGMPQGSLMPVMAITAFNGSYVDLKWECPGQMAGGSPRYEVFRNGAKVGDQNFGEEFFRDTAILSGAHYRYEVKFYS